MKFYMRLLCASVFVIAIQCPAYAEVETLEEAWGFAYQSNPSLQANRAALRATDEQVAQAQGHWRPTIDATTSVGKTYQYSPSDSVIGTSNFASSTTEYGVQVTQPIFRGWRTDSETEEAENQVLSGRAKLSDAEQQLFIDTGTAFLDVLRDQTILDVQRNDERVLEQKLQETQARARVGDLSQTDVHQAESRLARSHAARFQAETTLKNDRTAYLRLVGHLPEALKEPNLTFDETRKRGQILHLADTRNPKVLSAEYDEKAASADIDLNKGSLLPEIDLVGSSGRNYGESSTLPGRFDNNQILVQMTIPLYHEGSDYSKTRAAEQTAVQKRMELEEARHKAHEAADDAWQLLQASLESVKADKDETEAAQRAFDGLKVQARVGSRTIIDMLNAEQELLDAKVDLAKSQHDRDLSILQITAAIGELTTEHIKLPVETYDPTLHYHDVRNQWVGFSKDDARYGVPAAGDNNHDEQDDEEAEAQ